MATKDVTQQNIDQFKTFLTDQWIDPRKATRADAIAFAESRWGWVLEDTEQNQETNEPVVNEEANTEEVAEETPTPIIEETVEPTTPDAIEEAETPIDTPEAPEEVTETAEAVSETEQPTEEQRAQFPEWTFEWPSPVWVDQEWKLTTGLSPLDTQPSEKEIFANNAGIQFARDWKNQIIFQPDNLDQAIDLFNQFWPNVRIDKNNKNAIAGSTMFQKYNKYKGADSTTLKQALIDNDLWVGWETWDRLVKMNWWQETPAMIEARQEYELWLKTTNINENWAIVEWKDFAEDDFFTKKEVLDNAYIKKINTLFDWLWNAYKDYKSGNTKTATLQENIRESNARIDELRLAKRRVLDNIRKENPNLPLWQQLTRAEEQLKALDDQIFAVQRTNSIDKSALKDEESKLEWEYEFIATKVDQQLKLTESIYNIKRWDLVSAEKIAREDRLLEESIQRAEQNKKDAIVANDVATAKKFAYEIALAKEKQKISNKYQVVTPWSNWVAVFNPLTWEIEIKTVPQTEAQKTDAATESPSTTTVSTNFSTPTWVKWLAAENNNPGNVKMSPVNKKLAIWTDSQWHLKFPDMQTWMQALINDVSAKLEWRTRTWLWPNSTLAELANVYAEDNVNWLNNVSNASWYTADTKLSEININRLVPAIVNAETSWVTEFVWTADDVTVPTETDDIALSKKQIFVMSQLPTKLKDSDEDKKDIREFVAVMHDQWLDQFEIADLYQWFEVKEWDNFGKNIRNFVWVTKSRDDMWEIWRSINKWVPSQALRIIYRNANADAKSVNGEDYVSEQFTRVANSQVNKVLDFMWKEWLEDWVWVAEWTFDKWITGKFRKEVSQQILTDIIDLTATLSTKLSWTAKTEAELKFIEDLLPDLWDSPANFFIKLNNLKDFPLLQFNEQMSAYGLPELDDNTLSNIWARMELFENPDLFNINTTTEEAPVKTPAETKTWWKKKSNTTTKSNPFNSKNPFIRKP